MSQAHGNEFVYSLPVVSNIAAIPLLMVLLQNINRVPFETVYVFFVYTASFAYHVSYTITQSWDAAPTNTLQFIDHLFANGLVVLTLAQFFFWYNNTIRYTVVAILIVPVYAVYITLGSNIALLSVAVLAFSALFFVPHMRFDWWQWGLILVLAAFSIVGYLMPTGIEYAIGHSIWHVASFLGSFLVTKWGMRLNTMQPGWVFYFLWVSREQTVPPASLAPIAVLKQAMRSQWNGQSK